MKGPHTPSPHWEQLSIEFLVSKEASNKLTLKEFCAMRKLTYNTARVRMKRWLDRIKRAGGLDRYDAVDPIKPKPEPKVKEPRPPREKKPPKTVEKLKQNQNGASAGIYSKYFNSELIEQAASGQLEDDLVLYRAKALNAMDFMEDLQEKIDDAIQDGDEEELEKLEKRAASTDKSLSWCITRIESIAMTIAKLELTTVTITKERANIIKTRAQTRMTLQQTKKYRSEQALAKARADQLEKVAKGSTVSDIVKDIQQRRDLLPSFTKKG